MPNTINPIFPFILIQFLLVFQVKGQAICYGDIFLEEGEPAAGAFVSLVLQDSITMKKFTAADVDGKWQIKDIPKGDYYLNVRYLGCKELFYLMSVKSGDSLNISLQLKADALLLPGVEVKGKAIGISRSGDTLKFNLKYFSTGAEMSLGDILNQLPGVEVDETGTVKYAGKKVDKLLVQGKDILNNKHKLATESIRADQLAGIQVIYDYRDDKDIETKKSGKVALDVRIEKSEQEKWSGQINASAGHDRKWVGDLSTFKIDEKFGATFFAKANNTAEQVLSMSDYLGLKGMRLMQNMNPYGEMEDLLPKSFKIAPQTTKSLDALIAGSLDYDLTKKHSIKGDFILAQLERDEKEIFKREYILSDDLWSGNKSTEIGHFILSGQVLSEKKYSKKFFLALGLSGNMEIDKVRHQTNGFFNALAYGLHNERDKNQWEFIPEWQVKIFPTSKIKLNWRGSYTNDSKDISTTLSDIGSFLDLDLIHDNGKYTFEQSQRHRASKGVSFMRFTYDLKKAWYWGLDVSNEIGRYRRTYSTSEEAMSFRGDVAMSQQLNSYKFRVVLDTSTWLIKAGLSLVDNTIGLNDKKSKQSIKIRPNLTLKYLFSQLNFVMFTINTAEEVVESYRGGQVLEAMDSRQSKSYEIDWENTSFRESYALSYFNFGEGRGRMIYGLINYTIVANPIGTNIISFPNYTQLNFIRLPKQKSFNSLFKFRDKVANWPLFVKAEYRLIDTYGFSAFQSEVSSFKQTRHHIKVGFSSKWKKAINYRVNYALNITRQQGGVGGRLNQFTRHMPDVELSYADKSFKWKTKLGYNQSIGHSLVIQNWSLDTDISYKAKKSHWRYFIKGRNLLNLRPIEQIDIRFSSSYISEINYQSFPGYLLVGISREF